MKAKKVVAVIAGLLLLLFMNEVSVAQRSASATMKVQAKVVSDFAKVSEPDQVSLESVTDKNGDQILQGISNKTREYYVQGNPGNTIHVNLPEFIVMSNEQGKEFYLYPGHKVDTQKASFDGNNTTGHYQGVTILNQDTGKLHIQMYKNMKIEGSAEIGQNSSSTFYKGTYKARVVYL